MGRAVGIGAQVTWQWLWPGKERCQAALERGKSSQGQNPTEGQWESWVGSKGREGGHGQAQAGWLPGGTNALTPWSCPCGPFHMCAVCARSSRFPAQVCPESRLHVGPAQGQPLPHHRKAIPKVWSKGASCIGRAAGRLCIFLSVEDPGREPATSGSREVSLCFFEMVHPRVGTELT